MMKATTWLKCKHKSGTWEYGLGRLEDGKIVVAECFTGNMFTPVGNRDFTSHGGENEPIRLMKGERLMIVRDLYLACCEELGAEADKTTLNRVGAQIDKNLGRNKD